MSTVIARLNMLVLGWPTLAIGLIAIVVGSQQKPLYMESLEFLANPSLSVLIRIGAFITLVGFVLITIGYIRHDEDKI